jgi:hypothetical protein
MFWFFKVSLTWDFPLQGFFHESVYPGPLSIPLGNFYGDILKYRLITGVNDTVDKWEEFRDISLMRCCWTARWALVHKTTYAPMICTV